MINNFFSERKLLAPSFILLQRTVNFLYSYFMIQILSRFDFAIYSTYIYVCNFSLQLFKYGFDIRFQKILFNLNARKSYDKIKSIHSKYSSGVLILSFFAACGAIAVHSVFFERAFPIDLLNCFGIFFSLFGLFGLGLITTNCYAVSNFKILIATLIFQLLCFLSALMYINYFDAHNAFFIYSIAVFLPVFYILKWYFGLRIFDFRVVASFTRLNFKFRSEYIIYINNTAINFFQIILVSVVANDSPLWISDYRVLQSIHAMLSLLPVAIAGYIFNSFVAGVVRKLSHSDFVLVHCYLIIVGLSLMFKQFFIDLFPRYGHIIDEMLLFYLLLNSMTIISTSFIFSAHSSIKIRNYACLIFVSFFVSVLILYSIPPHSLHEFVYYDVAVQFLFYWCLVFSSPTRVLNWMNAFNYFYIICLFFLMYFFSIDNFGFGTILAFGSLGYLFSLRQLQMFQLKRVL